MDNIFKSKYSKMPLKLKTNRVWRTYTGGKLIDELLDVKKPFDSEFPEDWIASLVQARNPGIISPLNEGLSTIENAKNQLLKDLIEQDPIGFLGEEHYNRFGANSGVLIKFLDSAERLTIQVHPTKKKALELFNSKFGKTEAWYILNTRKINGERPYVLFGFKEGITKVKWKKIFEDQDITEMLNLLHKIYVNAGDLFLIKGGIPHAIGPGCFMIEIQEPTDYTIRTERITPKGLEIDERLLHQGIGFDKMFECFTYQGYTKEEIRKKWSLKPQKTEENDDYLIQSLINYEDTTKFAMNLIQIKKQIKIKNSNSFSILVVIFGSGEIFWDKQKMKIQSGNQIFLPYNLKECKIENSKDNLLKIIQCYPPLHI